jgi:predicted ATP-grasp superfamily ATP-dependent carboligase
VTPPRTVFVYEHCTATGLGRDPRDPAHSFWREGAAMRAAVATLDAAGDDFIAAFRRHAGRADAALVIAPEFDDILVSLLRVAQEIGVPVLGPTVAGAELAADKLATAAAWHTAGVPTPPCSAVPTAYPAVVKHRKGAGSLAARRLNGPADWDAIVRTGELDGIPLADLLTQPLIAGTPASVAFLAGPAGVLPLTPASQMLSADGRFTYLGGELPLPTALAARATALGRRALAALPGLAGYVGIDLILGTSPDGRDDTAIEANPRLTTSYVGLRALAAENPMARLLALFAGADNATWPVKWKQGRVRFGADGSVNALT